MFTCNTLHTWEVAILWECCFLLRFLWVKWPCHTYHNMDSTIQKTNIYDKCSLQCRVLVPKWIWKCCAALPYWQYRFIWIMYCAERPCFSTYNGYVVLLKVLQMSYSCVSHITYTKGFNQLFIWDLDNLG